MLLVIVSCAIAFTGRSATPAGIFIRGIVRDSVTTEGLPYSSVRVDGSSVTAVTDSRGIFELTVPAGSAFITASCQGYAPATVALKTHGLQIYDINLKPQATELAEFVVKKKEV